MLIRELIMRHVDPQGALHERGIELDWTQVPPGVHTHHEGADAVSPVAGDLLLISAPGGDGLQEHVFPDLPVGVTVMLLLGGEVTALPVGIVLAAFTAANLQVVEAAIVSGTQVATVAVVAKRTDELVVPQPYSARDLESGAYESPAILRRILGEHALEGLVQRARERELLAQVGKGEVGLKEATEALEQMRAEGRRFETMVGEHAALAEEHAALVEEHAALIEEHAASVRDLAIALREAETERKRMRTLRSSRSFKVASRLARMSGVARRITRQSKS